MSENHRIKEGREKSPPSLSQARSVKSADPKFVPFPLFIGPIKCKMGNEGGGRIDQLFGCPGCQEINRKRIKVSGGSFTNNDIICIEWKKENQISEVEKTRAIKATIPCNAENQEMQILICKIILAQYFLDGIT